MAQRDVILPENLRHTGIFSFTELYNFAHDWFENNGYKITEKKYNEKTVGDSKSIEVDWGCERKVTEYFKFKITAHWFVTGLKKVEVRRGNEKITMNSGTLDIKFSSILIKDYENRWESNAFFKFFRSIYNRYIIRSRVDTFEDKVEDEMREIIAQIKAFLALESRKG